MTESYWTRYRREHPEYAERERQRMRRRDRSGRDRTGERRRSRADPLPDVLPADMPPVRRSVVLLEDLAQEMALAKLERRRYPEQVVAAYARRERTFMLITAPLMLGEWDDD